MALKIKNLTMDGTSQSINPLSHVPVKWVRIESASGNADVLVGDKTLTATIYGFTVAAGATASKDIGPFGGGGMPFNLEDVFVRGTNAQVIHITYVTI